MIIAKPLDLICREMRATVFLYSKLYRNFFRLICMIITISFLLSVVLFPTKTIAAENQISVDLAVQHFIDTAFPKASDFPWEFSKPMGPEHPNSLEEIGIVRWTEPVRIQFFGTLSQTNRKLFKQKRYELQNIVESLDIEVVNGGEANVAIVLVKDAEIFVKKYQKLIKLLARPQEKYDRIVKFLLTEKPYCFSYNSAYGVGFQAGMIFVSTFEGKEVARKCFGAHLTRIFGLVYDASEKIPSVLNPAKAYSEITTYDTIALRTLYDPRIKPEMTREEAELTARAIISEMIEGGKVTP